MCDCSKGQQTSVEVHIERKPTKSVQSINRRQTRNLIPKPSRFPRTSDVKFNQVGFLYLPYQSFRRRREDYFRRPAIYHNHKWYPKKYLPDPEDREWSWKEGIEVDRPAQSAYQSSKGQVFWDPDRHKQNVGDHPHYKFKWHYDQINKDVLPEPIKHLIRPLEIGARFTIEKYPRSEYKPRASYMPNYHPEWEEWIVSDLVMVNLTNGRITYMGEIRPDTSAHIFQP